MSQNRKRKVEPDDIKESPSPKIENKTLEQIVQELKSIREEIKDVRKENEKKLKELRMEMKTEMLKQKEDALNSKSAQFGNSVFMFESVKEMMGELKEIKANQENNKTILEKVDNISKELTSIREDVPRKIRMDILGEWRLFKHDNFEGYQKGDSRRTFETFSLNLKYELENGLLKQTGGGYFDMREGENEPRFLQLSIEDNHLKTDCGSSTIDRFIQDGRLHVTDCLDEEVWRRVYIKI